MLALVSVIPLRRSLTVLACIVFAGLAEGFGVATMLPLVAVLGDHSSSRNALSQMVMTQLDRLHLPHDPLLMVGIIAISMVVKAGLTLLALRTVGHAVADVAATLRLRLIDALMDARWDYYVRQPVGRFSHTLGSEATRASEAYSASSQMISQCVQAGVYLTIAFIASWQVAALAIVVSLLMVGSLNRLTISVKKNAAIESKRMQSMLTQLTDVLVGIKPMKAMSRQAQFNTLFQRDLKAIKRAARRKVFAKHANKSLQEPILALCLAFAIYAAITVLDMPIGTVVVMSLLLAKLVSIVGKAQQELQNVHSHESGFWSITDAIDEVRANREQNRGGGEPAFRESIEFRDLGFGYGDRRIFEHLNLTIGAGEVVALTGSSGAGKTTLVDLVLGLHTPRSGSVLIDGRPLSDIDSARWRSLIGYVPQELTLFHDSIAANVTLGESRFDEADVAGALAASGSQAFVDSLPDGARTVVGERGALISGGQRQRIALARALVHKPRLLILDEATSALDPETEATIVRNVCALAKDFGITVLAISHHPAWVIAADRVLELRAGHLRELQRSAA